MARILLADDHAQVRSALRLLVESEPGLCLMGEAAGAPDLLAHVQAACPDLLLLDWELPGLQAEATLLSLRRACPRLAVIVLSGRPEARREALAAGADAFVSKGDPPEQLLGTLRALAGIR